MGHTCQAHHLLLVCDTMQLLYYTLLLCHLLQGYYTIGPCGEELLGAVGLLLQVRHALQARAIALGRETAKREDSTVTAADSHVRVRV